MRPENPESRDRVQECAREVVELLDDHDLSQFEAIALLSFVEHLVTSACIKAALDAAKKSETTKEAAE
jgi:hypothetical protein